MPIQQKSLLSLRETDWDTPSQEFVVPTKPPSQLLKWIGNKQRFAMQIASVFPIKYRRYFEPFVGSGAVLGAMAPKNAVAGDALSPLIEMWNLLIENPEKLYTYYEKKWNAYEKNRHPIYRETLEAYNKKPNPLDLVFLSRTCYGGVVRFTKKGKMSTPMGPHNLISPSSFRERMMLWRHRVKNTKFVHSSFKETLRSAGAGDIVYCDPPYSDSQNILYGAQAFKLKDLWETISECKERGALVALSIDGKKKSGNKIIDLGMPSDLFKREIFIYGGSSMLKRFQKKNQVMIGEDVHDRLLLTW